MKQLTLPNLGEMTNIEAIHWFTGEVAKVFEPKERINSTYSEDYQKALLEWKQRLNKRIALERN